MSHEHQRITLSTYLALGWQREILYSSTSLSHTRRSTPFLAAYFIWDSCLETPLKMMSSEGTPRLCTSSSSVWNRRQDSISYLKKTWHCAHFVATKMGFDSQVNKICHWGLLTTRWRFCLFQKQLNTTWSDNCKFAGENTLLVQMNPVPRAARTSITVGLLLHLTE